MFQKTIAIFIISIFVLSCSKNDTNEVVKFDKNKSFETFQEGVTAMERGDFFFASKKFDEAELLFIKMENAAKSSILSSYCLYTINFYPEALQRLKRFKIKYQADKLLPYSYYLSAVITFEQILDEKKDLKPLIESQKKIEEYLEKFPNTDYALDLKFKLDLVRNQLAAKEMYVAKYYIEKKKWVPAINRLKVIVTDYEETAYIEEALHRLVEIYYEIGLDEEANSTASILGYNYNSSEWYAKSYKVLNKDYKKRTKKLKEKVKKEGLIKRTIKKIVK